MALPAPKPSIDTCNACGKLFPRVAMRLCTGCSLVEEHRFQLVRDYLVEHDGSAVGDIARGTGVTGADVRRFVDGGRLVTSSAGMESCSCAGVGTRCRFCRSRLSQSFRTMERTMQEDLAGGREDVDGGRTSYVRRIRRLGET